MNLPNWISLLRIFLTPILVAVLLVEFEYNRALGVTIFLIASVSDLMDGYVARKRGQVTALGQLLDPLADKLLVSAAFVSLVELRAIPAWMVVLILSREFAVTGLRNLGTSRGISLPAFRTGKFKMFLQVVGICFLMMGNERVANGTLIGIAAVWASIVFSLISMVEYFGHFARRGGFKSRSAAGDAPATGTDR